MQDCSVSRPVSKVPPLGQGSDTTVHGSAFLQRRLSHIRERTSRQRSYRLRYWLFYGLLLAMAAPLVGTGLLIGIGLMTPPQEGAGAAPTAPQPERLIQQRTRLRAEIQRLQAERRQEEAKLAEIRDRAAPGSPVEDAASGDQLAAAPNAGPAEGTPDRTPSAAAPPPPDTAPPPAAAAAPSPRPARGGRLVVHYPAGFAVAAANARQLAASATAGRTRVGPAAEAPDVATVRFFFPGDHAAAREMGQRLAHLGYRWRIDNAVGADGKLAPGTLEVWLPAR